MQLNLLTFTSAVENAVAAAQAQCSQLIQLAVGSVIRATQEANAAVALWLQWVALQVLSATRLATSSGSDVDSWVADFGLAREPAVAATGAVTFSRYNANIASLIQPGAQVITVDQSQTFTVVADTTNATWSAAQNGYLLPIGTASATVPVMAASAGTGGNILAGTINRYSTPLPGIDNVTNALNFTGGLDAESDDALKVRFTLYIQGLSKATEAAILSAAESVQQGLKFQLQNATPQVGFYTLYVDNGASNVPDSLISAITSAVQNVTALGVTPAVVRPAVISANISVALNIAATAVRATVDSNVSAAIVNYVAALPIGASLPYLTLAGIILSADTNITGIASLTINSAASDLGATTGQIIEIGTLTVN